MRLRYLSAANISNIIYFPEDRCKFMPCNDQICKVHAHAIELEQKKKLKKVAGTLVPRINVEHVMKLGFVLE
jgi:hypothetical protein